MNLSGGDFDFNKDNHIVTLRKISINVPYLIGYVRKKFLCGKGERRRFSRMINYKHTKKKSNLKLKRKIYFRKQLISAIYRGYYINSFQETERKLFKEHKRKLFYALTMEFLYFRNVIRIMQFNSVKFKAKIQYLLYIYFYEFCNDIPLITLGRRKHIRNIIVCNKDQKDSFYLKNIAISKTHLKNIEMLHCLNNFMSDNNCHEKHTFIIHFIKNIYLFLKNISKKNSSEDFPNRQYKLERHACNFNSIISNPANLTLFQSNSELSQNYWVYMVNSYDNKGFTDINSPSKANQENSNKISTNERNYRKSENSSPASTSKTEGKHEKKIKNIFENNNKFSKDISVKKHNLIINKNEIKNDNKMIEPVSDVTSETTLVNKYELLKLKHFSEHVKTSKPNKFSEQFSVIKGKITSVINNTGNLFSHEIDKITQHLTSKGFESNVSQNNDDLLGWTVISSNDNKTKTNFQTKDRDLNKKELREKSKKNIELQEATNRVENKTELSKSTSYDNMNRKYKLKSNKKHKLIEQIKTNSYNKFKAGLKEPGDQVKEKESESTVTEKGQNVNTEKQFDSSKPLFTNTKDLTSSNFDQTFPNDQGNLSLNKIKPYFKKPSPSKIPTLEKKKISSPTTNQSAQSENTSVYPLITNRLPRYFIEPYFKLVPLLEETASSEITSPTETTPSSTSSKTTSSQSPKPPTSVIPKKSPKTSPTSLTSKSPNQSPTSLNKTASPFPTPKTSPPSLTSRTPSPPSSLKPAPVSKIPKSTTVSKTSPTTPDSKIPIKSPTPRKQPKFPDSKTPPVTPQTQPKPKHPKKLPTPPFSRTPLAATTSTAAPSTGPFSRIPTPSRKRSSLEQKPSFNQYSTKPLSPLKTEKTPIPLSKVPPSKVQTTSASHSPKTQQAIKTTKDEKPVLAEKLPKKRLSLTPLKSKEKVKQGPVSEDLRKLSKVKMKAQKTGLLMDKAEKEKSRSLRVQFTDPASKKKAFIDPEFLAQYDPELVKKIFKEQITILRAEDLYTDSEFDEMDDEIYEIILSYATRRKKNQSSESLECQKSSGMLGDTGILNDLFKAFRKQKLDSSSASNTKIARSLDKNSKVSVQPYPQYGTDAGGELGLETSYFVTVENVEQTLLRDFSPERKAISEDRCFRVFNETEPGPQVIIPNAVYSCQEFILTSGYDPEGPLLTDQVVQAKLQICLDVASMYFETLSLFRAGLLIHLALNAPPTVQGYLRQLAESVVNRRINTEDEINGFLNKVHDMATGQDVGHGYESSKVEQDNFRLIQRLKKKIFSEFYRKVGFWEIKNGEEDVSERHLKLLQLIPRLYKTGLFPFIDFISEFIANNKITSQDQLEVALSRFLACSDGQITRQEFADWCMFSADKRDYINKKNIGRSIEVANY